MEYRGRRAAVIENAELQVTVLREGGHVAEIFAKATGVNPLWTPPWPSMEPSAFNPASHTAWGTGPEARLLAGIMGHNLCLDIFGGPSEEEAAAGLGVHGEASLAPYEIECGPEELLLRACLPASQLTVERRIRLRGPVVEFTEAVENLTATDRPIGWTQHVTLGPPFVEGGATRFEISATRSKVFETAFGPADYLVPAAEFDWPLAPRAAGGTVDLRTFNDVPVSGGFTTHLMDPARANAFFVAWSPRFKTAIGYVWRRADFPWLGIWEENRSRTQPPWNGETITRGMEFGVSPMPETRRRMIERGRMFDTPCFRWIPARSRVEAHYRASAAPAAAAPSELVWSGTGEVRFA